MLLLFSSPVRHFVLLCFRDLAVNWFDFNFLRSISTFCTQCQLLALFGTNRRVLSRCVCWNFRIYIFKAKIDTWSVNQRQVLFASWYIRDLFISFFHFVKTSRFAWNLAHKRRDVSLFNLWHLKCSLKCTWPVNFSGTHACLLPPP